MLPKAHSLRLGSTSVQELKNVSEQPPRRQLNYVPAAQGTLTSYTPSACCSLELGKKALKIMLVTDVYMANVRIVNSKLNECIYMLALAFA